MPGVVGDAAADAATSAAEAKKVKLRPKPGSCAWSRPKTQIYDTNYAKGSRLYADTLGKIGANSLLASTSDRFYRPSLNALGSYVDSLLGPSATDPLLSSPPLRTSTILRSSHARDTGVTSWMGSTMSDLGAIGETREKSRERSPPPLPTTKQLLTPRFLSPEQEKAVDDHITAMEAERAGRLRATSVQRQRQVSQFDSIRFTWRNYVELHSLPPTPLTPTTLTLHLLLRHVRFSPTVTCAL